MYPYQCQVVTDNPKHNHCDINVYVYIYIYIHISWTDHGQPAAINTQLREPPHMGTRSNART